ncbi:Pesticin receptor [Zhongshania aliphaticivorans]|uniref:Pesticin receptor n=1 Tax=Zhongshania aliphaticivorans TaxID=1470434 RepID=A0A5S9NRE8_9GAMM|nr:TonB-dependent receptor [Zhongshania aliphaticivorans]CAA0093009.1 Pesticin receptor [Zhongshania aliphaticivorans]
MRIAPKTPAQFLASVTLSITSMAAFSAPQLEEVIVTAQKRTESIQDVPVSINAVSADTMAKNGIGNLEEMSSLVPNLNISDSPNANVIVMRGLGSGAANPSFEQSVGLYVDGIYAGRSAQFQIPFLDVQRVEVLRGPQGVIFGKNSIAGAISIHSEKPSDEFEAEIQGSYEFEYGSSVLTGILSGPILDSGLGARLVVSESRDESFIENHYSGDGPGEPDQSGNGQAVRLSVDWAASDTTDVLLKVEHSKYDEEGSKFQIIGYDRTAPQTDPILAPITASIVAAQDAAGEDYTFNTTNYQDGKSSDTFLDQDSDSVTLNVAQQVGDFEVSYTGGYSAYDRFSASDGDFSGADLVVEYVPENFEQVSHELRFTSPVGERFVYMGGLYYLDRTLDLRGSGRDIDLQLSVPPALDFHYSTAIDYYEESEAFSGFVQGTWNITDAISATLGVRRSVEEKSAKASQEINQYQTDEPETNPAVLALATSSGTGAYDYDKQTRKEANTDGTFNLQWVVNDDVNLYFTHARATKGGGFNATESTGNIDGFEYDEERARNYEIGAKMELFDRRLRLNTALFYTEFENLQVSTLDETAFVVENAGEAESKGLEVELTYLVSEDIMVGLNAAVLRARYTEFQGTCPQNVNAQSVECQNSADGTEDFNGEPLLAAPDASGSAFIDYTKGFGGFMFNARLDAKYSDQYYFDSIHEAATIQDAFWKFNANVGISNLENSWGVSLSALNITDERTINFGGQSVLVPCQYCGNLEDPRMYTLNFRYAL